MVNQNRLVNEFIELVKIDSLSGKEGKIAQVLIEKLKALGLEVTVDNAGEAIGGETGNVIARLPANSKGEPILFSAHMDTVTPGEGIKPIIENGIIKSGGTTILGADDKSGIASILEGLRVIIENNIPHAEVEVVFSISEEVGLNGAKNMDYSLVKSKYAFVLDSGGSPGEMVLNGPCQDKIDAKIIGRAAHAGICPQEGVSAIMIAARAIDRMKLLRIDPETTANVGIIQGGLATNIITPEVSISAEARSLNEGKLTKQTEHMTEVLKSTAFEMGGRVEISVSRTYPPFNVSQDNEIVKKATTAFKNLNLTPEYRSTGGGSDTNILNGHGITAITLGNGEKEPHSLNEHIWIVDLVNSAKMVAEIIRVFAESTNADA